MKTIKQIADELGVSKTAVRQKIKKEFPCNFRKQVKEVSGVFYIDEELENIVKQRFSETIQKKQAVNQFADISENQFAHVSSEVSALISTLQKELDAKNKLIDSQQQTIIRLTEALTDSQHNTRNEQLLHADTKGILPTPSEPNTPSMGLRERIKLAINALKNPSNSF